MLWSIEPPRSACLRPSGRRTAAAVFCTGIETEVTSQRQQQLSEQAALWGRCQAPADGNNRLCITTNGAATSLSAGRITAAAAAVLGATRNWIAICV